MKSHYRSLLSSFPDSSASILKDTNCNSTMLSLARIVGLLAVSLSVAAPPKVVIFLMFDDVGWHDTSVPGHSNATGRFYMRVKVVLNVSTKLLTPAPPVENLTPAIADLAASGVILDRAYAHFMCAPSRCSFLTGRLPVHVQQGQAFPETDSSGIPRNMTAIGNKMKAAGYRSHFVGKRDIACDREQNWDAGMATPTHVPQANGTRAWRRRRTFRTGGASATRVSRTLNTSTTTGR